LVNKNKIRTEDKEKRDFSISKRLWQFTVMLFDLYNAPTTFERLMEKVLGNLISKICLVYDKISLDVIVFRKNFAEITENLRIMFLRLREVNLKVNPKKYK